MQTAVTRYIGMHLTMLGCPIFSMLLELGKWFMLHRVSDHYL